MPGGAEDSSAPPRRVREAFGLDGEPIALPGGQGTSWRVGDAVLKPADAELAVLAWQADLLTALQGRQDFRVARPLPAASGAWSVEGWTATRYEPGTSAPGRWRDVLRVADRFHAAVAEAPEPPFLATRTDRWALGDRVAWGELDWTAVRPADGASDVDLRRLLAALRPLTGRRQLVHGDLSGNVLFQDELPPLVIDLSPYWRPPDFASAVVVADALLFDAAGDDVLDLLGPGPDVDQYLLRALVFRLVAHHLAPPRHPGPEEPFSDVVDRALRYAVPGRS